VRSLGDRRPRLIEVRDSIDMVSRAKCPPQQVTSQEIIVFIVLDKQHFDKCRGHAEIRSGSTGALSADFSHVGALSQGKVIMKIDPLPSSERVVISPPWRVMIFLQIVSPMPVPS
jgi:hypothetical protein